MHILELRIERHRPFTSDVVSIKTDTGIYQFTDIALQKILVDQNLMCASCFDEGYVLQGEADSPRSRKCLCVRGKEDDYSLEK